MRKYVCALCLCLLILAACAPDRESTLPATEGWPRHIVSGADLSFAVPPGWTVHDAAKALQITPNSQPTWSSYADPDQPHDGPTFDLLYNLNRQMGATPLEEVENLLLGFEGFEVVETAVALPDRPDVVLGVYRSPQDGSHLLLGAVAAPRADSPAAVVALVGAVDAEELVEMRGVFAGVLASIGTADLP